MDTQNLFNKKATQDNFASEKIDVIYNSLLGTYNNKGEYMITGNVLRELFSMKKYTAHTFNNSIFCVSLLNRKKQFNFEVVFYENKKENLMIADLYVLENVSKVNGYFSNTIKTIVAKFEDRINDNFVETTKKFFNISSELNDGEKEIDESVFLKESDVYNIISKSNFNDLLFGQLSKTNEKNFESIFKAKLKALKQKNNIFGQKVLEEFNSEYSKIERHFFVDEKGKVKYKGLNELLDKSVEMLSGTDITLIAGEQQFRSLIKKENDLFINTTYENEEIAINLITDNAIKNSDQKILNTIRDLKTTIQPEFIVVENKEGIPLSEINTIEKYNTNKTIKRREVERESERERVIYGGYDSVRRSDLNSEHTMDSKGIKSKDNNRVEFKKVSKLEETSWFEGTATKNENINNSTKISKAESESSNENIRSVTDEYINDKKDLSNVLDMMNIEKYKDDIKNKEYNEKDIEIEKEVVYQENISPLVDDITHQDYFIEEAILEGKKPIKKIDDKNKKMSEVFEYKSLFDKHDLKSEVQKEKERNL